MERFSVTKLPVRVIKDDKSTATHHLQFYILWFNTGIKYYYTPALYMYIKSDEKSANTQRSGSRESGHWKEIIGNLTGLLRGVYPV